MLPFLVAGRVRVGCRARDKGGGKEDPPLIYKRYFRRLYLHGARAAFVEKYFQEIRERRGHLWSTHARALACFHPLPPPPLFSLNVTNRVRVYLLNRTRNIVVVEQSWPWHEKRFFLYVGMNILLAEHGTATTTSDIGAAMVRQRSRLSRVSRFSWLPIFP